MIYIAPNIEEKQHLEITYPNGYTASIIRHTGSYGGTDGLFEIAIKVGEDIVYDTPITGDVLGYLTESDVRKTLEEIKELPKRKKS